MADSDSSSLIFELAQSGIQPALPADVCGDSTFKLAFALCLNQDFNI